jgi:hypothetical protein
VSCDYNATNASQEVDIFTLARDKGAVSAVSLLCCLLSSVLNHSALLLIFFSYFILYILKHVS